MASSTAISGRSFSSDVLGSYSVWLFADCATTGFEHHRLPRAGTLLLLFAWAYASAAVALRLESTGIARPVINHSGRGSIPFAQTAANIAMMGFPVIFFQIDTSSHTQPWTYYAAELVLFCVLAVSATWLRIRRSSRNAAEPRIPTTRRPFPKTSGPSVH